MSADLVPYSSEQEQLLTTVRQAVSQLFLQYQDPRRVLYNYDLSAAVAAIARQLATQEQYSTADVLVAELSGLYYPLCFCLPSPQAIDTVTQAIDQHFAVSHPLIAQACQQTVRAVQQQQLSTKTAKVLSDAMLCIHCNTESKPWADLRQLEQELIHGKQDRQAQLQLQIQELLAVRYHTEAGRHYWQTAMGEALLRLRKRLEKTAQSSNSLLTTAPTVLPFSTIEEGMPVRAAQTYFRAVYRNHINLSAIADNKANIMISVNAILISVLITFLSYRNIAETQPMVLLPVVIFLVVGLTSLVFAVLSARPKVTSVNKAVNDHLAQRRNLAFFGNFVSLSLDQFEEAMDEILADSHLVYGNMVRDLYFLGKVLDKKYRYLTIAYNIFMLGLIVTVALFLVTLFYQ